MKILNTIISTYSPPVSVRLTILKIWTNLSGTYLAQCNFVIVFGTGSLCTANTQASLWHWIFFPLLDNPKLHGQLSRAAS